MQDDLWDRTYHLSTNKEKEESYEKKKQRNLEIDHNGRTGFILSGL